MKTSRGEGGTVRAIGEDVSGIAISSSATMGDALPADADLRASGGELLRDSAGPDTAVSQVRTCAATTTMAG